MAASGVPNGRDLLRSASAYEAKNPLADSTRSKALLSQSGDSMGGVGLVFCRDTGSPYLLVKEVVHDGPAFQSSLIYPGDKLCCINDFDLAWSGNTTRDQQPQLPGPHGSNVVLTFDRSLDPASPERFAITLIRSKAFFPDKLTGSLFNVRSSEISPSKSGKAIESTKQEPLFAVKATNNSPLQLTSDQSRVLPLYQPADLKSLDNSSSNRPTMSSSTNMNGFSSRDSSAAQSHQNGWKGDTKTISTDYKADLERRIERGAAAVSDRFYADRGGFGSDRHLDRSMTGGDDRNQFLESQQENKYLQDTVQALRKDLTDCHVQITFLQRQLKAKADEAAGKASEAALAEKNSLLLKQKELEANDLQGKLSKEKIQREAAERKIVAEKEEYQKLVSLQQDMKVRIENFQEMLVKETVDRQKVQKRLSDAEQELQAFQALKDEFQVLQKRNEDILKELQEAKHLEQTSTTRVKSLQEELKLLQAKNDELTQELANSKHQLARSEKIATEKEKTDREGQTIPENSVRQAESSVYDVLISTGTPEREHERSAPVPDNDEIVVSNWGVPHLQTNTTPTKASSKAAVDAYPADVELHQSPGALRNEAWRQGVSEYMLQQPAPQGSRGQNITFTSAPISPNSRMMPPSNSPSPIYVSPHRLDDSPSMLYQKQNFQSAYGAPAEYLSIQALPIDKANINKRPSDHQGGQTISNVGHHAHKNAQSRRAGIGMSFNLDPATRSYVIKEVHPLGSAGQAAANGDLLVGDVLLAINGISCDGKQINEIINLIVGQLGSEVQLTLRRRVGTEDFQITLTLLRNRPLAPTGSEQRSATMSLSAPPYAMEHRPATIAISPTRSPKITHAPLQAKSPASLHPRQHPSRTAEWERPRLQDNFSSNKSMSIGNAHVMDGDVPLPPGWIQELDPSSGRMYFVNHNLKTFCWNRPA